jgi:hypothetical protein
MAGHEHWDFFGKLPKENVDLNRMCIWEYARECKPLVQAVDKLRTMVGSVFRIGDDEECARETYRRVRKRGAVEAEDLAALCISRRSRKFRQLAPAEKRHVDSIKYFFEHWPVLEDRIRAIVPRFNWRFLCSPGFPAKPWLLGQSECGDLSSESLFLEPAIPVGGKIIREVRHGKKTRNKSIRRLPRIHRIQFGVSGKRIVDIARFEDEIAEIAGTVEGDSHAQCFIIPNDYFLLYDAELLAASLREQCHLLDRRRLTLNNEVTSQFERTNCSAYLRALGMMRLFHEFDEGERNHQLNCLSERKRIQSIAPAKWKKIFAMIKGADGVEARRTATKVLRRLFRVSAGELPISYKPHH